VCAGVAIKGPPVVPKEEGSAFVGELEDRHKSEAEGSTRPELAMCGVRVRIRPVLERGLICMF
jgi:hypothetical protein